MGLVFTFIAQRTRLRHTHDKMVGKAGKVVPLVWVASVALSSVERLMEVQADGYAL